MSVKSLLISGYRHTDLGIFSEKDPRLTILKKAIYSRCVRFLEEGVEWFVFTGNLGFEYWTLEVLKELRSEGYEFSLATIFCFETHGENWNENNQAKRAAFNQVDFVKYCFPSYQKPSQFREYNQFLVDNTDATFLFYDSENETSLKYLVDTMGNKEDYRQYVLQFDDLNELAENF